MGTHRRQTTLSRVEERILLQVMLYSQPFCFQLAPPGFGQVEMGRVRRQVQQVQACLLPIAQSFLYLFSCMDSGAINHQKSRLINATRKAFQLRHNKISINAFSSSSPMALIGTANECPAVQARSFGAGNEYRLAGKLPAVG